MKKICIAALIACMIIGSGGTVFGESTNRLGGGLHYWTALDDITDDGADENGFAAVISYQRIIAKLFKMEVDFEILDKGYAGSKETVYQPQGYFLVGTGIYAGAGIGINYSDNEFAKEPFYALRAGLDIEILPSLFLDIHGNYRFEKWDFDAIEKDVDADTITLGAIARIEF